jgi:ABC-type sulfate transport system permease component
MAADYLSSFLYVFFSRSIAGHDIQGIYYSKRLEWTQRIYSYMVCRPIYPRTWNAFFKGHTHQFKICLGLHPAWRLFTKIELPLLKPILRTSALFAFALSMGEVNAVLILSQPGDVTIPLAIYRLMGSYNFNGASAMGTLLIFITMAAFILMEKRNHADRI